MTYLVLFPVKNDIYANGTMQLFHNSCVIYLFTIVDDYDWFIIISGIKQMHCDLNYVWWHKNYIQIWHCPIILDWIEAWIANVSIQWYTTVAESSLQHPTTYGSFLFYPGSLIELKPAGRKIKETLGMKCRCKHIPCSCTLLDNSQHTPNAL